VIKRELPNRKPMRYSGFDYSSAGYYFITVCADEMKKYFGIIRDGKMILNSFGRIVEQCWNHIPGHFENVEVDCFQIMPDHLHGIIIINSVGNGSPVPHSLTVNDTEKLNKGDGKPVPYKRITLSDVVGYFKYQATKEINKLHKTPGKKIFQRSFYDRIIRNQNELLNIRNYIIGNPMRCELETNIPQNWDIQ
jgi:REP element-mobilizing transposase RayT